MTNSSSVTMLKLAYPAHTQKTAKTSRSRIQNQNEKLLYLFHTHNINIIEIVSLLFNSCDCAILFYFTNKKTVLKLKFETFCVYKLGYVTKAKNFDCQSEKKN